MEEKWSQREPEWSGGPRKTLPERLQDASGTPPRFLLHFALIFTSLYEVNASGFNAASGGASGCASGCNGAGGESTFTNITVYTSGCNTASEGSHGASGCNAAGEITSGFNAAGVPKFANHLHIAICTSDVGTFSLAPLPS